MSNKPTILVTGANGQVASEIGYLSQFFNDAYSFIFTSKDDLPIEDFIAVENFFNANEIDFCINCAAYTAVDKAESDIELAYAVNEKGVYNLAVHCAQQDAVLIHLSTDYVFDGFATAPISELKEVAPLGVYGASKLKGEIAALENCANSVVIRTSWVYSRFGNNFVKTMMRLMTEREQISVVNDQIGRPTFARDLASAILQIIETFDEELHPGIYHFSNTGEAISWYDFAQTIKEIEGFSCLIHPIATSDYPTAAKRPAYSVLDTTKFEQTFDIFIPDWKESLQKCLNG